MEHTLTTRIVSAPEICHGQPCIAGTRIMAYLILDLLAGGMTVEEIISPDYYPGLSRDDVLACIRYASDRLQND